MSIFSGFFSWLFRALGLGASGKGGVSPSASESGDAKRKRKRRPRKRRSGAAAPVQECASAAAPAAEESSESEEGAGEKRARERIEKKQVGDWQIPAVENREEGAVYFQDFPLEREVLRAALDDLGFVKCTPIQGLALPAAMGGKDIAGKAQTGTGKTAVFLMSMLHEFLHFEGERKLNQPFALVLAPTRELAIQIARDAENLSVYTRLRTVAVYGGMDYDRQRRLLQAGCDLVVATPGRLIDYLKQRVIDTSALKVLIIDEADRMLDMGFIPDVKRIVNFLPAAAERQTMLFSATLSREIMSLAERWMRPEPVVVESAPEKVVADGVNESVYACTADEKLAIMLWILRNEDCGRVMIFSNRKRDVEHLQDTLQRYGVNSAMLSGDVSQNRRLNILEEFRSGKIKVVVATDVAGRGIQVDNVTHVFNYDLPYEAEDYVHRVGRTARAGSVGRAISFASEDAAFVIPEIESYIGRALPITQPSDEMLVLPEAVHGAPRPQRRSGGDKGGSAPHRSHGGGRSFRSSSYRGGAPRR